MKKLSKIFVLLFTFFVITNAVLATNFDSDVLTSGDIVNNVKAGFNFEASENVELDEDIEGSNLVFGNNVTVNSLIKGVNLLFGNNLTYDGVSEYAAIFGNVIRINGEITNDGAIFGNMVVFDKASSANRDIIIFGNNVTLSGTFNRTVRVYASSLAVKDAIINGNIKITADDIEVDSDSSILSTFEYNDDADFKNNNKDLIIKTYEREKNEIETSDIVVNYFITIASSILLLLVLLVAFPKIFDNFDNKCLKNDVIIKNIGIGLVSLILIPIVCLILIISSIGSYLGILLAILFVLFIMLSFLVADYTVGRLITNKLIKKDISKYLSGVIGIIIMFILKLIPFIGGIIIFISLIYGIGSIINIILKSRK